uniref:RCC1 domain-containing protein n=1 Tax=Methanocella arvoryzae TaxID=1175445 RepID=UPI0011D1AD6F|nr:hypothetical protein [Methanocella arvoryzae]
MDISTSDIHELVVLSNGTVWAWGSNSYGQCSPDIHENNIDANCPVMVAGLSDITAVSARLCSTSLALKSDGTVWAWGSNTGGGLGRGIPTAYDASDDFWKPEPVPGLTNVIAIAASPQTALALKDDGTVWAWGMNDRGQLGTEAIPMGDFSYASSPVQVEGLSDVKAIATGCQNGFAVKNDGTVWAWGAGSSVLSSQHGYKVGVARTPVLVPGFTDVKSLSIGGSHALLLKNDGSVWAWGSDWRGALGINSSAYDTPDCYNTRTPVQVPGLADVVAIDVSNGHSVALCGDGSVWSWGANYGGQIGDGSLEDVNRPWRVPVKDIVLISGSSMVDRDGNIYKCTKQGVSKLDFKFNTGQEQSQQAINNTELKPVASEQPAATVPVELAPSEQATSTPVSSTLPGGNSVLTIGVLLITVVAMGFIVYLAIRK